MIETYIRKKIQPLFDAISTWVLIPLQITPNTITLIAFITGILAGGLISINHLKSASLLLILSGLCDVLDGTVARISQQSQKIGAYIDLISDRMVEAAIVVGFTILYPQHYFAYILFFVAVMLHFSTFIVAGSLFPNMGKKSMHYDHSIVERAEAFVVFAIMISLPQYIFPLLMVFNVAIFGAGITRFFRVLDYVRKYETESEQSKN